MYLQTTPEIYMDTSVLYNNLIGMYCCLLHTQVDKLLSTYLELYDVVLTGDASMDIVNAVLRAILT